MVWYGMVWYGMCMVMRGACWVCRLGATNGAAPRQSRLPTLEFQGPGALCTRGEEEQMGYSWPGCAEPHLAEGAGLPQ